MTRRSCSVAMPSRMLATRPPQAGQITRSTRGLASSTRGDGPRRRQRPTAPQASAHWPGHTPVLGRRRGPGTTPRPRGQARARDLAHSLAPVQGRWHARPQARDRSHGPAQPRVPSLVPAQGPIPHGRISHARRQAFLRRGREPGPGWDSPASSRPQGAGPTHPGSRTGPTGQIRRSALTGSLSAASSHGAVTLGGPAREAATRGQAGSPARVPTRAGPRPVAARMLPARSTPRAPEAVIHRAAATHSAPCHPDPAPGTPRAAATHSPAAPHPVATIRCVPVTRSAVATRCGAAERGSAGPH